MSQVGALDTMDLKILRETLIDHGNKTWIKDVFINQTSDSLQMAILLEYYNHKELLKAPADEDQHQFLLYAATQAPDAYGHAMNDRGVSDSTVYELLEAKFGKMTDFSAPVFTYESYQNSFYATSNKPYHVRTLGDKRYELTNHLGNVLAVVSDRKIGVEDQGNPGTVEYYEADVVSAQDYYPFGMIMPGRSVSSGEYRYGFNSEEMDNEWANTGSHIAYEHRMHDTRLGRFLSVDPLANDYSSWSPYHFANNTPIQAIDIDGLEAFFVHGTWSGPETFPQETKTELSQATETTVADAQFEWSGNNVHKARDKAADKLVNHVIEHQSDDEPLTLVGHSHGGNVAIEATNRLQEEHGIDVDNIITINTPVRDDYQLNDGFDGEHFNVYHEGDIVQTFGGDDFNIPDGLTTIPLPFSPNPVIPTQGGERNLTGEVGPAGRMFEGATNIEHEDVGWSDTHQSHQNVNEWIDGLNNTSGSEE